MMLLRKLGVIFTPTDYIDATQEARAIVCNGCGPDGWKGSLVPDTIVGCVVTTACDIHDWMYNVGGSEIDKDNADKIFRDNLIALIMASNRWTIVKYFGRQKAWWYYRAVRITGRFYFKYKNLPG
jgi:hypothetical protein